MNRSVRFRIICQRSKIVTGPTTELSVRPFVAVTAIYTYERGMPVNNEKYSCRKRGRIRRLFSTIGATRTYGEILPLSDLRIKRSRRVSTLQKKKKPLRTSKIRILRYLRARVDLLRDRIARTERGLRRVFVWVLTRRTENRPRRESRVIPLFGAYTRADRPFLVKTSKPFRRDTTSYGFLPNGKRREKKSVRSAYHF